MKKIVVYAGTRNYYAHMLPAVTSLLVNSSVDRVYLLIEDDVFPYKLPDRVHIINVSNQGYFKSSSPNYNCKWTYMAMMKMALPYLLPQYDRYLYLDVDTIVDKNIDDIWDIDMGDCCFAAVKETHKSHDDILYFNAGVLLIDRKNFVDSGLCDSVISALNTIKFPFPEQDCMNKVCSGKIREIPSDYNVSALHETPKVIKIIHYATYKDWSKMVYYQKYMHIYQQIIGGE